MAGAMKIPRRRAAHLRGFSLIELIGVMAIIAILAAVAAPTTLRTIDRAAVRAELDTLHRLGDCTRLHLRRTGALPTSGSWKTDLGPYTDLSPNALDYNARHMARVFLVEPTAGGAPSTRVLFLSSMRTGLTLPATVNAAGFAEIWDTSDGQRPASWVSWPSQFGEYLAIGRVNLAADLQSFTLRLQNTGAAAASYKITRPGAAAVAQPVPPGFTDVPMRTGWRIDLFSDNAGATLRYSYIVTTHARSFHFDGTTWTAP